MTYTPLYLGQALGKLGYDTLELKRGSWAFLNRSCREYCLMNNHLPPKLDYKGRSIYETEDDFSHLKHTALIFLGSPDYIMPLYRRD